MNTSALMVGSAHPTDCRLVIDPPASGAWNMAVDEALLLDAAENGFATLRFYQWSEPTLSLGYFQRHDDREQHAASRECAIVRRQTGGGAILHDRELTYSLALPANHPLTLHTPALYAAVHRAFIAALASVDPTGELQRALRIRSDATTLPTAHEPFLCFERRSPGDVVWVRKEVHAVVATPLSAASPQQSWKVLGSAQRRHRGAILQHGSLLVEKSPRAPRLLGLRDLSGLHVGIDLLTSALTSHVAAVLGAQLVPFERTRELESITADLANNRYGRPAWTNRR